MNEAGANSTADLRIYRAQVAVFVMRQRLVLRLFRHRVRDAVRKRTMLCKQQGEDEKQRQKWSE